jgi:hypothetical protein
MALPYAEDEQRLGNVTVEAVMEDVMSAFDTALEGDCGGGGAREKKESKNYYDEFEQMIAF